MVVNNTTQVSLELNGKHMMIIDALVAMNVTKYNEKAYRSIANSLEVSFRVVRRAHEAHWPLVEKMIGMEKEMMKLKIEFHILKNRAFPGFDNGPAPDALDDDSLEVGPVNMELAHMERTMNTVDRLIEMQGGFHDA